MWRRLTGREGRRIRMSGVPVMMMAACCLNLRPCHLDLPQDRTGFVTFTRGGLIGVPAKDILRGTLVDQPYDDVSVEFQGECISLSLQWPGYESNLLRKVRQSFVESMVDEKPTTRQELAIQICFLFFRFHKMASVNFKQATVKENLASVRMTSVRQMLSSTLRTIADTRIHGSQSLTLLIEQVSKDIIGCTTSDHQLHYTLTIMVPQHAVIHLQVCTTNDV